MEVSDLKAWIFAVSLCGAFMPYFGTENGVSVYPVGMQTVMKGLQPNKVCQQSVVFANQLCLKISDLPI